MDCDQTYYQSFLRPADPHRFATEIVALPRQKETIYRANTNDEIDTGYKLGWMGQRMSLKRLDSHGWSNGRQTGTPYNAFRNSIQRSDHSRIAKKWFFSAYSDATSVSFIQFDIDRHFDADATPWERHEIEHAFETQVTAIRDMAEEVGCDIVWTTSPGDLIGASFNPLSGGWEGGEHIQGLYAWIKLSQPVEVRRLRKYVAALKDYWSIESESSVDSRHRLIRLPGQRYVEVTDPKTLQILYPAAKPEQTLSAFAQTWRAARSVSPKTLFGPALAWESARSVKPRVPKNVPVSSPLIGVAIKNVTVARCSTETALAEKNTFEAATSRRICSRLAIKYRGQRCFFDQAVKEAKQELVAIRPLTSKTCTNPALLHSTVSRWLDWYFASFDTKKCGKTSRDVEDARRVQSSISLAHPHLLRYLQRHLGLSFREQGVVSLIFDRMKNWRGRIHCRVLYELAGGKQAWLSLLKKLSGCLVVLDEWHLKKCRQWGWSKSVIAGIAGRKQASKDAAALLAGAEQEKKGSSAESVEGFHRLR